MALENIKEFESYINDVKNYKRVRRKQVVVWVSKPAIGTKVVNKVVGASLKTTVDRPYIISGTRSDYLVASEYELASDYEMPDGTPISFKALRDKEVAGLLEWTPIQAKIHNQILWGCFVPAKLQYRVSSGKGFILPLNRPGVAHGKGDFIVCKGNETKPFLEYKTLVNGLVFADCYDNRGWQDKLLPGIDRYKRPDFDIIPKALNLSIAQNIPDKYRNAYKTKAIEELKYRLLQIDDIFDRISALTEEEVVGDRRLLVAPHYTFPESIMRLRDLAKPNQSSYAMGVMFPLACYVMTVWVSRNLMNLWRFHTVHSLNRCGNRIAKGGAEGNIKFKTSDGYLFSMAMHGTDTLVIEVLKAPKTRGAVRYTKVKQYVLTLDDALEFTKSLEYSDNMVAYRKDKTFESLCSPANPKISGMNFTKAIMSSLSLVFDLRPPTEDEVAMHADALLNVCCATVKSNVLTVKDLRLFYDREQDKLNQTAFLHIDGDNDMSLQLTYKIEIKGNKWGIRVNGKSANHIYDRYFKSTAFLNKPTKPTGAQTFEDVVAYNEKRTLFANEMFLDICKVLGVSPLRRFFYDPNYRGIEKTLFGPVLRIKGDTAFVKPELSFTSAYTEYLREHSETITVGETVYTHNFKTQVYKGERVQEMSFEIMGYNEKEGAKHKRYAYRGKLKLCYDVPLPVFLNLYQAIAKHLVVGLRCRFKDKEKELHWTKSMMAVINTTFMSSGIALSEFNVSNKSNWMYVADTEPVYDTEKIIGILRNKLTGIRSRVADRPTVVLYASKDTIQGNLMVFGIQGTALVLEEYSVLLHNEMTPDVIQRMSVLFKEFDITYITEEECDYIRQNTAAIAYGEDMPPLMQVGIPLNEPTFVSDFELFEAFKIIPEGFFLKEYGITEAKYKATKETVAMEISKLSESLLGNERELTYINLIKSFNNVGVPNTLQRCLAIANKYVGTDAATTLINLVKKDDSYLIIEAVNRALVEGSADTLYVMVDKNTGNVCLTRENDGVREILDDNIVYVKSIKRNKVERVLDRKGVQYNFDYTTATDSQMQAIQKVVSNVIPFVKATSDGKLNVKVLLNESTNMLYVAKMTKQGIEVLTGDLVALSDISITQLSDELDNIGLMQDFASEYTNIQE